MKTYLVEKKTKKTLWENVPGIDLSNHQWEDNPDVHATAKLLWDRDAIYVRLEAEEKHIRAKEKGRLAEACQDSCLEFFFCPMKGDKRYFNIEMTPHACFYLGLASSIENIVRLVPEESGLFQTVVEQNKHGWSVTYRVPASFIRRFFPEFQLESGKEMRANFYKCGDLTEKPHYLSWNKIGGTKISFHQPQYFGKIILH